MTEPSLSLLSESKPGSGGATNLIGSRAEATPDAWGEWWRRVFTVSPPWERL